MSTLEFDQLVDIVGREARTILDIGANDGGTSRIFQQIFPSAFIYAFEPEPRALINFKKRIVLGQFDLKRLELNEYAVSDKNDVLDFYPSDGFDPNFPWYSTGYDLSGSLFKPLSESYPGISSIYFRSPISVQAVTLDHWFSKNSFPSIDLIWMDVQGAELSVIEGGTQAFNSAKVIYLECMEQMVYQNQPALDSIVQSLPSHKLIASYSDDNHLFVKL